MIFNFRAAKLVAVAAVVMAGLTSSASAQAGQLTADGPVTLDGTQTLVGEQWLNSFTLFGGSLQCPGSTYTGHKVGTAEAVPNGSSTITITPTYVNCKLHSFGSEYPATVQMNGCDYVFHIGETTFTNQYALSADVVCPKEAKIHISAYTSASHSVRICTDTIGPQTGLSGAIARSTSISGDFDVEERFRFLSAERTGLCGSSTTTSGEWHFDATFNGTSALGSLTSVSISD
jgi:hypothetical protein